MQHMGEMVRHRLFQGRLTATVAGESMPSFDMITNAVTAPTLPHNFTLGSMCHH